MAGIPIPLRVTRSTFDGLDADDYGDGQQFIVTDEGNALYEATGADGARSFEQIGQATEDIDAADFGSGAAVDGYVLTADGAGGAAWEEAQGGRELIVNDQNTDPPTMVWNDAGTDFIYEDLP